MVGREFSVALGTIVAFAACGDDLGMAPGGETVSTTDAPGTSGSVGGDSLGMSEEISGRADASETMEWSTTEATDASASQTATDGSEGDETQGAGGQTDSGYPPTWCEGVDCDDGDPCTDDSCDDSARACFHAPVPGLSCDDGNACTTGDTCQADGSCAGKGVCTVEHCGTISQDETWGPDVLHLLTCSVMVEGPANPRLTIQDGTTVLAAPGSGLYIGLGDLGGLEVKGADEGVLVTAEQPLPAGAWDGISLGSHHTDSQIAGTTLERAGTAFGEALSIGSYEGGTLMVTNSTIRESPGDGIFAVYESALVITSSEVLDNEGIGLRVEHDATLEMHSTSVIGNGGDGLAFEHDARLADSPQSPFTGNLLTQNGGAPIRIHANDLRHLDGTSSFAGNGEPIVVAGTAIVSGTWHDLDEDFFVPLALEISGFTPGEDVIIEIEPGVTLLLDPLAAFMVGDESYVSAVHALGTADSPIHIIGGVVRFTGNLYGDQPTSQLDHVVIEQGEGLAAYGGSEVHISNSIIRDNMGDAGIVAHFSSSVGVANSTIENNAGNGIEIHGSLAFPFSDNVVTGNDQAATASAEAVGYLHPSSTFLGNDEDIVRVYGSLSYADASWHPLDVPYRAGLIRISNGTTLTLQPGVTLEFYDDGRLDVGRIFDTVEPPIFLPGTLIAVGTPEAPITFRSSAPAASPGAWAGILVHPQAPLATFEHCIVQHAGGDGFDGAIVVQSAGVSISSCTITGSATWGIYQDGVSAALSANTFAGNAAGDVFP